MSHPYLTNPTRVSGFFAIVCSFAAYVALTSDPEVERLRSQILRVSAASRIAGTALIILALVFLGFATYWQLTRGPSIRSVETPIHWWRPRGARGWAGVFMFIFVGLLMAVMVFLRFWVLFTK